MKVMQVLLLAIVGLGGGALLYRENYRKKARKDYEILDGGIEEEKIITINGIKQWLFIRGQKLSNPMILFIHGGPGSPMTPMIYKYQKQLEDEYTVVNWEQRNTGKTYFLNKEHEEAVKETLCMQQYVDDIYEVVCYLKEAYHQEIIIMGHSWGSSIGALFVKQHPELVKAYIGVGQNLSISEGEKRIAKETLKVIDEKEKDKYLKLVSDEKTFALGEETFNPKNFGKHRAISERYLMKGVVSSNELIKTTLLSPFYSLKDVRWFFMNNLKLQGPLLDELGHRDLRTEVVNYEVPMIFISGDKDWVTPYPMIEQYCEVIEAPFKKMIFIKDAGHSPMLDQPDEFAKEVKQTLKIVG